MWYLIIPPIIVVASLLFVLWYLSRKVAEPVVADKISQLEGEAEQKVSFSRTKSFFLRILEKTAYRFKVRSLQMHNVLNDVTQSLKEKRNHIKEMDDKVTPEVEKEVSVVPVAPALHDVMQPVTFETEEMVSRPMVSEKMVHPEVPYQKTPADVSREEGLIARIGANPKDFTSYERLGDYYLEIGNIKDAKECYRQVLKLSPAERMVKVKIRRLEKMFLQRGQ